ncbi:hypothetical protein [Bacteroides sp.]
MAYDKAFDGKTTGRNANYSAEFATNKVIEEQIGLELAKDSRVAEFATKIMEKSQVPSYTKLEKAAKAAAKAAAAKAAAGTTPQKTPEEKRVADIDKGVGSYGGARAFKENWGTLGGSVFAVMNEIETTNKAKYSISHSKDHPYFPEEQKKPEFDEPIRNLKFDELPTNIQNIIKPPITSQIKFTSANTTHKLTTAGVSYDDLNPDARGKLLYDMEFGYKSAAAQDTATALKKKLQILLTSNGSLKTVLDDLERKNPDENTARTNAITEITAAMSNAVATPPLSVDDIKAQLGALLDIVADKHTSGDHANLVKKDGTGGVKDQWIDDTIDAGKPIISGPSGHTLRYLNFWAEKRTDEQQRPGSNLAGWPSLEAARLVMMANLMPPKHHSYDEIMTSSIGITDKITPVLQYKHKSSYEDLDKQTQTDAKGPAQNAYTNSNAALLRPTDVGVETNITKKVTDRQQQQADIETITQHLRTATSTELQNVKTALRIP